jgi:hypothetical protein
LICTVTARRLKPGTSDDFVEAFKCSEVKERWTRVYICRDVADDNSILTFGLFEGTLDELREIRSQYDQLARANVDAVLFDGSYEVLA